ncbi:MAG: hypothetical protein E5W82_01630 [Mesorhizobium sp.]|uniref:hypothetical protein n=1 Tax=Mesorhizobium sp. TaxID=1871066 RepID=UPI00120AF55F|nr:hypothetical protein [Mesorhizobium sp.]TIS53693.1 MAG: hypothetical protein E5W91_30110 [Mesorhizobium sp.]TJW17714.1 MAG: hypothetical protein E5W82_01630 [Mesorhizobium sp.]TJW42908.1 MAG: hypothetical protein E5W83_18995 [Mesorhizobium sp.]
MDINASGMSRRALSWDIAFDGCSAVPFQRIEDCKGPPARRLITPAETMKQAYWTSSEQAAKPDSTFADRWTFIWRAIGRKIGFHFC